MPFMWVYQASDFVGGLPAEAGSAAGGGNDHSLSLSAGATPVVVEVTDDDNLFHEVDTTQSLTSGVTLNGTDYLAGDNFVGAYYLENSTSGHMVTGFHVGTGIDGYGSGAVVGITSTVELVPGTTYTFDINRTTHNAETDYNMFVACFLNGTKISTPGGERPVERLMKGHLVSTLDQGAAKVLWHAKTEAVGLGNLAPFRIEAQTLGNDRPLFLSSQHRVLLGGPIVENCFGDAEVLCPIKHLAELDQVSRTPMGPISYHHLMLENHELVTANGALAESFLPGPFALRQLAQPDQAAPMLPASALTSGALPARPLLTRRDAFHLIKHMFRPDLRMLAPRARNPVSKRAYG